MLLGRTYQKYFQTRRPQFIDCIREIIFGIQLYFTDDQFN